MNLIVALCKKNNGIGINNSLPWLLKNDLKYFKNITSQPSHFKTDNIVVMGRKTWDSIPDKNKPLKNRINIILTNNTNIEYKQKIEETYSNTFIYNNIDDIIKLGLNHEIFIIGGSSIYKYFIDNNLIKKMYITEIYSDYDCDVFFPNITENINIKLLSVSSFNLENDIYSRNIVYINTELYKNQIQLWENTEENQYLKCLKNILENGIETHDRTNVGTYSTFAEKFTYNLEDTFPALTTRRVFMKGIFEELMLYISGKTDNTILNEKNIHIWDGNTSREFLDNRNLKHYPDGDMGETYGFNFRHFGANYNTCKDNYDNHGFDQLNYVIDLIKNNPNSRRIIINLWNPSTMHKAALPACLCFYQFYVDTKNNKLNLQIYIRSSDYFLANNWNACTGALLVNMICNLKSINLTPGKLSVITGDTHIYKNHQSQVEENLKRTSKPFPKLIFINGEKDNLEDYSYNDIKLIGYNPDKNISAPMAV